MVGLVIRRPTTILALLTALNLLNYLDRFVLSAVLKGVQDDLHLDNATAGSLGTVFLVGFMLTSPLFGIMADRAGPGGRTKLIAVGIMVWSAATVASGVARTAASLVATRAFVGVGEAAYATIAPTIVDDVAPPTQKGRWQAIFFTAIPVGAALGYILGGAILSAYGWRRAFYVAGGPGLAVALLCLLIAEPAAQTGAPRPAVLGAIGTLARLPLYRNTVLGYCAHTFALGGFAFWAPKYLSERYRLEPGHASFVFGLITVAGGLIGTLAGGWFGDRVAPNGPGGSKDAGDDRALSLRNVRFCSLSAAIAAPLSAATILAPSSGGFFGLLLPCEVALFLLGGPINVVVLRAVPPELRSSAMAINILAIHALGDLWAPLGIGLLADLAGDMRPAMFALPVFFAVAATVWWRAGHPGPYRVART
jgi:MFS family permease